MGPHLVPWVLPVVQLCLSGSTWATVALTLERYISVARPFSSCSRCQLLPHLPHQVLRLLHGPGGRLLGALEPAPVC